MNVQRASVTGALKALAGRSLINYSPYSFITLTPSGREVAREVIRRHGVLKEFFMNTLQLGAEEAEANACTHAPMAGLWPAEFATSACSCHHQHLIRQSGFRL